MRLQGKEESYMSLTSLELAALEARLEAEITLVKKYAYYTQVVSDPRLKNQFEFNRVRHMDLCQRLRSQLH